MNTDSRIQNLARPLICMVLVLSNSLVQAQSGEWTQVTGADTLRSFMSGLKTERELSGKEANRAEYNADGTGVLHAWGGSFARTWEITGNDQLCVTEVEKTQCFTIEKNATDGDLYRVVSVTSGQATEFRVVNEIAVVTDPPSTVSSEGGAGTASAEELAAALSNPTAPVMTLGNNFDYIKFDGDLAGAGDESAFRYVFQTAFPYKLSNGGSVFFRPALPVIFNDPIPNGEGGFDSAGTDLGDMGFDFSYGITTETGLLWGGGMVGTIPTATDDVLGKNRWAAGPELLLGIIRPWGIIGGVLSQQWDFAGSGDAEINQTGLNYFYAFSLGGGWQIASGPSISYDHTKDSDDAWTIPLGVGIAKTTVIGGRPWKFQLQYWNYVEAADPFAPKHQLRLSINPVLAAPWNEGR